MFPKYSSDIYIQLNSSESSEEAGGFIPWVEDKLAPPLITGVVISVIASFLIARATERYRGKREHLNRSVDALRAQLAALQTLGVGYWMSGYDKSKSPSQELEIEFLIQDISSLVSVCAPDLWEKQDGVGPSLVADLAAAATGPAFGTVGRKAAPAQARLIATYAAALSKRVVRDRRDYMFLGKRSR